MFLFGGWRDETDSETATVDCLNHGGFLLTLPFCLRNHMTVWTHRNDRSIACEDKSKWTHHGSNTCTVQFGKLFFSINDGIALLYFFPHQQHHDTSIMRALLTSIDLAVYLYATPYLIIGPRFLLLETLSTIRVGSKFRSISPFHRKGRQSDTPTQAML